MRSAPAGVRRVAVVGAGTIGAGWALHFLRSGLDVAVFDATPAARARLADTVARRWPVMERLGLKPGADPKRLAVADTLERALDGAEAVQENIPDRLDAKVALFADLDRLCPPDVPLLSSTSGYAMSDIQAGCRHPGRTAIGHPFNPPYLVPLVEVVGGRRSAPETVAWAEDFYRATGKKTVRLEREVPGFVANRLQAALRAEALHMVAAGEATVEEIDAAVRHGPGLRWAIMGPFLTFHLAGGAAGIEHSLDGYAKLTANEPRSRLKAPETTEALRRALVEGCRRLAEGRDPEALVRWRDERLVDILHALEDRPDRTR